jgi:predicted DNA-binding protein
VAATSLKLPDELKRRLERLAANVQKSPHAFMVEVLAREAERAEHGERFAADAADAQTKVLRGGKTIALPAPSTTWSASLRARRLAARRLAHGGRRSNAGSAGRPRAPL